MSASGITHLLKLIGFGRGMLAGMIVTLVVGIAIGITIMAVLTRRPRHHRLAA